MMAATHNESLPASTTAFELAAVFQLERRRLKGQRLSPRVKRLALMFDGRKTLLDIFRNAGMQPEQGLPMVTRLAACGVLRPAAASASPPADPCPARSGTITVNEPTPVAPIAPEAPATSISADLDGFNTLELSFFDAEIPPIDACDLPFETWWSRLSDYFAQLVVRFAR